MKEAVNFWNNLHYSDKLFSLRITLKVQLYFSLGYRFLLERSGTMWIKTYLVFILLLISFKGFSHVSEEAAKLACEAPFQTPPFNQEQYSESHLKRAMMSMNYQKILENYPYLEREDEIRLLKLYKKYEDKRSFQVLFLSGVHLVYHVTWDYINQKGGEYNDYFQVGITAFLKAIEKHDLSRGTRLNKYARTGMRRAMNQYDATEDRLVAFKKTEDWQKLKIALIKKLSADKTVSATEIWIRNFAKEHPEYSIEDIKFVLPFVLRWKPSSTLSYRLFKVR